MNLRFWSFQSALDMQKISAFSFLVSDALTVMCKILLVKFMSGEVKIRNDE